MGRKKRAASGKKLKNAGVEEADTLEDIYTR